MAWNKPSSDRREEAMEQRARRSRPAGEIVVRGLVAGVIVVGIGVAALLFFRSPLSPGSGKVAKPKRIQDVQPVAVAKPATNAVPKAKDPHEGYVLSSAGVWQPANRPYRANAKKVHNVFTNYCNVLRKDEPVAYRNATEQLLLQTFSCRLGQEPMPFLKLPRKDMENLLGILVSPNPVTEKDSPELAANKEILAEAKKKLIAYMKEGGNPNDFFEHYHRLLQQAAQKRRDALMQLNRIIREEHDPELARQFRDKVNEMFEKEGIMKISKKIYDEPLGDRKERDR